MKKLFSNFSSFFLVLFLFTSFTFQSHTFYLRLSNAALGIVDKNIVYDPAYRKIAYPNGDVPKNTGVCTDVVIRAYRKVGIDLQKEVHLDMKKNFKCYPKTWGHTKPDTNIDHRRVPNLQVFFKRFGTIKPITQNPNDYKTGDIVTWLINDKLPHIGIVTHKKENGIPLLVHNVGYGQVLENCLFSYTITGHYAFKK